MANPSPPVTLRLSSRPPATVRTLVRAQVDNDGTLLAPAVFLDRDGTLMQEVDYCKNPEDVALIEGTTAALKSLKDAGFKLIIITNQSGIGRGYFTEEDYHKVQGEFLRQLGPELIDGTYFCAAIPEDDSPRRKPAPGMVFEAMLKHKINPILSFFVGDKMADITCGRRAGTKTVLVNTGYGAKQTFAKPDIKAKDIVEAAQLILNSRNG